MNFSRATERASTTLIALCFTTVLAISVTSYVVLCQRSYDFSTRQMLEEKVRQLAQTGLEESLWALNQNSWSSSGPSNSSAWSTSGANRTVTLAYSSLGQGASGQLALTVANYASSGPTWPTITSVATVTLPSGRTVTKTLQATTRPAPLFGNAIASANGYVSFTSGGTVDSWNSDPGNTGNYTTAYSFSSSNAANYAAVVAASTDGNVAPTNAIILNQALIRGYTATFGNNVSYSTSGSPRGKVQGPGSAVDVDGMRLGRSAFIPASSVFTVNVPSASSPTNLLSSLLNLVGKLLGTTIPPSAEVYEFNGNLTINGIPIGLPFPLDALASPSLVIEHPVTIVVDGDLTLSSLLTFRGKITVKPTGSLLLFVTGDLTIGADGIDNQTNDPRKVAIFCTSSSTTNTLQYTTSEDFCGVIYCENKPIDIRQNATFSGALLSGQYVRFSTSATNPVLHYDTALGKVRFDNVTTPYLIDQLTEP